MEKEEIQNIKSKTPGDMDLNIKKENEFKAKKKNKNRDLDWAENRANRN